MSKWFPRNYSEAVKEFQNLIHSWSGQGESGRWDIPSRTETDLFTDHLYLPAKKAKKTLLVLMSGVHGPETYAGHAIQKQFVRETLPRLNRDHLGVFMVHALNPYGFKFNKRHTENGVNLNRNCSVGDDLYQTKNSRSLELSERFIPKNPLKSETSELFKFKRHEGERVHFDDISLDDFIKAVAPGQFTLREGLEFGGFKAEPQVVALRWRLREVLPAYKDILFFDLHTGLGHRGRLHLLTGDSPQGLNSELFNEVLRPAEDQAFYEFTPSHAEGFYSTFGSTNDLFAELGMAHQRVCALTMEFGTLGHDLPAQLEGLNLWLTEHQGNLYGYSSPELRAKVEAAHLEKSNPSSREWQQMVLTAAGGLLSQVLTRLGALAA